jgi:nicotinamidase-related amidase
VTADPVPSLVHPSGVIPQALVDKVVARRDGRLHMYPTLDGTRTALVVVDLDEHSCARSESAHGLFAPVNTVAAAIRAAGGIVAFVTTPIAGPEVLAAALGDDLAASYHAATEAGAATRLAAGLDVRPGDLRATKAKASAFFPGHCDLPDRLRALGIEHVLIAGLVTNVCCESSARDANELGYRVTMVCDALSGQSFGLHEASLATWFRSFGDVRPSAEVVGLLAGARLP